MLIEPSHTSLASALPHKNSNFKSRGVESAPSSGNRWQNVDIDRDILNDKLSRSSSIIGDGCILVLKDPAGMFSVETREKNRKKSSNVSKDTNDQNTAEKSEAHAGSGTDDSNLDGEDTSRAPKLDHPTTLRHVLYSKSSILSQSGQDNHYRSYDGYTPRRGDLVVFSVSAKGGAKDIRVVQKNAARFIHGHLSKINLLDGTALFVAYQSSDTAADNNTLTTYEIKLHEVVSCQPKLLKDMDKVEGILHENAIYGVSRSSDLYLVSKVAPLSEKKERPRLNLTVKKELQGLGGKIIAQSGMAKGPDGSRGFADGWTTRRSLVSKS